MAVKKSKTTATGDATRKKVDDLKARHEAVVTRKAELQGRFDEKKEELAALVKEIKAAGYDPKKLPEERAKLQGELEAMINGFEKDLGDVESALAEFEKK